MTRTLAIVLCIAALIEYYSFVFVQSVIDYIPQGLNIVTLASYIIFTCFLWMIIIRFRKINWERIHPFLRDPFVAMTMGIVISKILVAFILLFDDIRRLVLSIGADNTLAYAGRPKPIIGFGLLVSTVIITGFIYGMTKRYKYRIVNLKLQLRNLPEAFKGFRIVQISDIHTGSFDNYKAVEIGIEKVLDQKPDVILFTGDLVNNRASEVDEKYKAIYSRLKAPMGVFSILGNHDYGDYVTWETLEAKKENLQQLINLQEEIGWKVLLNEHTILKRAEDKIGLIGIENWSAKSTFPQYGDLYKASDGLTDKGVNVKILLSHDPSHWQAEVTQGFLDIDLTLSGHTHGMQLGIESKWFKWSPVQYFYRQWAGLYEQNGQYLYVNRGFGFLTYPGRLGIMPEITVIDLI